MAKRSMGTWPEKWGFIDDLRECVGKTIEAAHWLKMPYGCSWDSAWVVRFTDGSRAFFVGSVGSGIVSPDRSEVETCPIFTPEEVGELSAAIARKKQQEQREARDRKLQELERLKAELGQ